MKVRNDFEASEASRSFEQDTLSKLLSFYYSNLMTS